MDRVLGVFIGFVLGAAVMYAWDRYADPDVLDCIAEEVCDSMDAVIFPGIA